MAEENCLQGLKKGHSREKI